MNNGFSLHRIGRLAPLLVAAAFALAFLLLAVTTPAVAHAKEQDKAVRVGWYESSFNTTDQFGHKSGYAYEYQLKLAAYTGWHYEYVKGSWSELMEMLKAGEIDLMSDVSYTPEREGQMLFPSLPMGTEEYYLFVAPSTEVIPTDYAAFAGKRIGVNEGSLQAELTKEWAKRQGIDIDLYEVDCSEDESLELLAKGRLDAYVTVDSFVKPEHAIPVCKIGSSDYFFVVNKDRPDLLSGLNFALGKIQDENRYYNQQMFEKHVKRAGANVFLTSDEVEWLADHGSIRVGYQDNYLAFCTADENTGRLTGALKDVLDAAADSLANAHIDFQAIPYPSASDAFAALKAGEVDCVFPSNLGGYDGEQLGIVMTPLVASTEVYALVRQADQRVFVNRGHVVVAVNEGNPNYDAFLLEHYPTWNKVYYPTTEECLKAVADNVADCVLISSYRYSNLSKLCDKYHLANLAIGDDMDYYFAVNSGKMTLYSILTKAVGLVQQSTVSSAMSRYVAQDARYSFSDFIQDYLNIILASIITVVLVILTLLVRSMRAEHKAKQLISATEIDKLTGLYNRNFFFQYADRMYEAHPDAPMDAIVLNIDRFHTINALNGWDFGNQVLRALGDEARAISEELNGIAGRFESDRFDIYCRQTHDHHGIYQRLQNKLTDLAPTANIRLRMGVMPWQQGLDPIQLFDRARVACSMARSESKERLVVFNEELRKREMYEQRLLSDLQKGLAGYQFELRLQPKYDIRCDPPRCVGAEALVRWNHPELGMVGPNDFIPLFEKSGQIGLLDKYVWEETARVIARWQELYGVTIPVSVNLSRVDVFDPALETTLEDILHSHGLSHDALRLEVTESAYTENAEQLAQVVEGLRDTGYEVSMDDFGTGYSSLNMLSAMSVDVLKMDRRFVQNVTRNKKDVQMVKLVMDIARNLGIPVIAEGVETKEQLELLKDLGCACVQGYYFSRPIPTPDFEAQYVRALQVDKAES